MAEIRLLYLEDEQSLGSITYDMLVKNGFMVHWVQDGRKALELFHTQPFDACVADIMMPGMDGYSFVREIRKADEQIPVIFLSARTLTDDVIKGFEAGGNDYLKKPFSIEELIVRIHALLRRKPAGADTGTYTVGRYTFSRTAMELQIGDRVITLTARTNELIHRLVQQQNKVLDRRQTLLELWGDDTLFNSRSMDVFITRIRKYFAEDPNISIVNVRGIGYKLLVRSATD